MQYDWSGVKTRRIRIMKLGTCLAVGLLTVVSPILLMHGSDIETLIASVL